MKPKKVVRLPHNRTCRREKQLEFLEAQKELVKGNRISLLKFSGLMIFFTILITLLFIVTRKASSLTPIIMEWLNK